MKKNDSGMFAIMLEQEDGTYKESDSKEWPADGTRVFDEKMSGCMDADGNNLNDALSYDSANKKAVVRTQKATYCYLYFSFPKPDIKVTNVDLTKLNTGKYIKSLNCGSTGTATFNTKYQRIEFGSITAPAECSMNYTEDTTTYPTLKSIVESEATTNANGYRYSGKTPDNWIWFNNEFWRIIGSIPTCTSSGCATSENLVKIIRAQSIGGLAYDYDDENTAWGSNSLYTLLSTYYYGKLDATGLGLCSGSGTWSNAICNYTGSGISSDTSDYYSSMIQSVYWNTGASSYSVTPGTAYTNETAKQTVSGHIGLMSISDYGYAADSSYHSTSMSSYSTAEITGTNWLYGQGNEWTNVEYNSNYAVFVSSSGASGWLYGVDRQYSVRPVLYLDSSVYVVSGEGTQASPYMIGLGGNANSGNTGSDSAETEKIEPIFNGSNMTIDVSEGSTSFSYSAGGTISCTSSNTSVVTCSNNSSTKTITVTPIASGTATITVTSTGDTTYNAGSVTYSIEVTDTDSGSDEDVGSGDEGPGGPIIEDSI